MPIGLMISRSGNGDGVLQKGEKARLRIKVSNLGTGIATEPMLSAKNETGPEVFLSRGRDKLKSIPVNGMQSGDIEFQLRDSISMVKFRLSIWDAVLGASVTETVKIPVAERSIVSKKKTTIQVKGSRELAIRSGASPGTSILGYIRPGAALSSDRSFDLWRRIDLPGGGYGFLPNKEVQDIKGNARKLSRSMYRSSKMQSSPAIKLKIQSMITTDSEWLLQGEIIDEQYLKDIYIFVNEKKVFYRSLDKSSLAGSHNASEKLFIRLPLEEGANAVAIIARENDQLVRS